MSRKLFALAAILALLLATAFEAGAVGSCTAGNPNASLSEATPTSAFTDNLDGTVTHGLTGLMWKRCAQGQTWDGATCAGSATDMDWSTALAAAVAETTGGHGDWRLPNEKELESLVEYCGYSPAINRTIFPATPASYFWSSSSFYWGISPSDPPDTQALYVNFSGGNSDASIKTSNYFVRLVRGGQSFDSFDALSVTSTLTYNGNTNTGGSAPVDGNSPYFSGSWVTVLDNSGSLVKTNYTFSGWNTMADGSGDSYYPWDFFNDGFSINADTTLHAQWTPLPTYTLTYDGNTNTDGSAPIDGSSPYVTGSTVTVLDAGSLVKTNHTFSGWNTVADGSGTAYAAAATFAINADTTLHAQWTPLPTYTVTYDGNTNTGGSAPVDGGSPYYSGSTVTVLDAGSLVKTNHTFSGWNTVADGSGTAYAAAATFNLTADTTLYAQWTPLPTVFTISGNVGVSGVRLTYTDGSEKTAYSDSNGDYSFTVSTNWSGVVRPRMSDYDFSPFNRIYSNVQADKLAQNYTASVDVDDADGDGVNDKYDNCPTVSNPGQSDANNNGIGDACDFRSDSDNDGVSDRQEVINRTNPLVSDNGSINPDGESRSGILLDSSVAGGGNLITMHREMIFNGSVVGTYQIISSSGDNTGQYGEVRLLPNPDHTFSVAGTDYTGITANDQSVSLLADLVKDDDSLALIIDGKKGSGMNDGSLLGEYVFTELQDGLVFQDSTVVTQRLALSFDGLGDVDYSTLAASNGTNSSGSTVYSVLDDGTLELFGGTGFVSPDGEVIMTVDTNATADDNIHLGVGVRRGTDMSKANLFGEFVVYEMGYEAHTWTSRIVYTFNGVGGSTYERTDDSDGQIGGGPVPLTYNVDGDGNVTISGKLVGVMSANGEYLVFADTSWADVDPGISMSVGVKSANNIPTCIDGIKNGNETGIDSGGSCLVVTPLNDTTEFVKQVYRDFLSREAEPAGLDYWVGSIDSGTLSRAESVEKFLLSPEFEGSIAPVARLYFSYFLRIPDYEGLMYWINRYKTDLNLFEISERFAQSAEFTNTYGSLSNGAFVNLVYQNVLGRAADPGGFAWWQNTLDSGAKTRGEVMVGFSESPEYIAAAAHNIYVTMAYIGLLRRAPEQAGYDYWVGVLDRNNSGLALLDGFLASPEYAHRF